MVHHPRSGPRRFPLPWPHLSAPATPRRAVHPNTERIIMQSMPPIIMSSVDQDRLERLLSSKNYRQLPGVDALEREINRATVVEPTQVPPDVVTMNSTIRFVDDVSASEFTLTLVYPKDAGPADRISILAPVGSALLGLSVGQSIVWRVPGGRELNVRVLEVIRQPEAMGEYHR
jgi:regulator of nucleoside diphosphate kinase